MTESETSDPRPVERVAFLNRPQDRDPDGERWEPLSIAPPESHDGWSWQRAVELVRRYSFPRRIVEVPVMRADLFALDRNPETRTIIVAPAGGSPTLYQLAEATHQLDEGSAYHGDPVIGHREFLAAAGRGPVLLRRIGSVELLAPPALEVTP